MSIVALGWLFSTLSILTAALHHLTIGFSHRQDVGARCKEAADAKENEKLRASVRAAAENLEVPIPDLERLDFAGLVKWARKLEAQMIEETQRIRAQLSSPPAHERQRWPVFGSAVDYETVRAIGPGDVLMLDPYNRPPKELAPYGPPPESGSTKQPGRGMIDRTLDNWYKEALEHVLKNRPIAKGSQ